MSLEFRQYMEDNADKFIGINIRDRLERRNLMREFHLEKSKSRRNEDGSLAYVTEQASKDDCDINLIIKRYPQRVVASRLAQAEAVFADVSGRDFQEAANLIKAAESNFMKLEPEVRSKFDNDPAKYLDFLAMEHKAEEHVDDIRDKPKRVKGKEKSDKKIEEIKKEVLEDPRGDGES